MRGLRRPEPRPAPGLRRRSTLPRWEPLRRRAAPPAREQGPPLPSPTAAPRAPPRRPDPVRQRATRAEVGSGAGRHSPADPWSRANRTRRRTPIRPLRPPLARTPSCRVSRRRSRDAAASPCSHPASRWKSSCRRRERCRRTKRCRLPARAPASLRRSRCRHRDADPPRTGGRGRSRTAARRARRPASSRQLRLSAAREPPARRARSPLVARRTSCCQFGERRRA